MKVYKDLNDFKKLDVRTDITIGNFDGFHIGHRKLIDQTVQNRTHNAELTAITFDPMPEEFFKKTRFFRIMSIENKIKIFSESGFKHLFIIPFNKEFSQITADDFIKGILIDKLNISSLTIGSNFRFGHKRLGDINLLKDYAQELENDGNPDKDKFYLNITDLEKILTTDKSILSSSYIRELIISGDFRSANKLLKNPISISGKVEHGEKRGRELGYPTANINIYNFYPINGIFLVEVFIRNKQNRYGLASWGNKYLGFVSVFIRFDFSGTKSHNPTS